MFDLHCHLLPGIDDGATDLDMALAMARIAAADGIETVACTPHIYPGLYDNTAGGIRDAIAALQPELVLGTQMERHIAKRLRIPCAVISAPVHVQDFPARYSPQMGFEGANVLFDSWVHPLVMGLEEHLLTMFRDDFEFSDGAGASHLGHGHSAPQPATELDPVEEVLAGPQGWTADAEKELLKIPFFVRGKARRNTERYANENGLATITIETLYDAKAHYAR